MIREGFLKLFHDLLIQSAMFPGFRFKALRIHQQVCVLNRVESGPHSCDLYGGVVMHHLTSV